MSAGTCCTNASADEGLTGMHLVRQHGIILLVHVVPGVQHAVSAGHEEDTRPARPHSHAVLMIPACQTLQQHNNTTQHQPRGRTRLEAQAPPSRLLVKASVQRFGDLAHEPSEIEQAPGMVVRDDGSKHAWRDSSGSWSGAPA